MDIISIGDDTDIPEPPPGQKMGLKPRDFRKRPQGCVSTIPAAADRVFDLPLATDEQIEVAIKKQAEEQSSAKDVFVRNEMEALDQDGQGYCWGYSTTSGIMLSRPIAGLPYVRLSGHMIGCLVKGYRDQGGYNLQSVEFAQKHGVASTAFWKEKSMAKANDTPAMREDAKKYMIVEAMDLDDRGDRLKRQLATCLINNIIVATDYNWWRHSVLAALLKKWGPNGRDMTTEILNSWNKTWSDRGWGELTGSRAIPNGAIAIRVVRPKAA